MTINDSPQHIYKKSLEQVRKEVLDIFGEEDVRIILFGSRARGDYSRHSDIDIGILPKQEFDKKKLILLKEKLEDINIPYKMEKLKFLKDDFIQKSIIIIN